VTYETMFLQLPVLHCLMSLNLSNCCHLPSTITSKDYRINYSHM